MYLVRQQRSTAVREYQWAWYCQEAVNRLRGVSTCKRCRRLLFRISLRRLKVSIKMAAGYLQNEISNLSSAEIFARDTNSQRL